MIFRYFGLGAMFYRHSRKVETTMDFEAIAAARFL
jgi:hypothetical protein